MKELEDGVAVPFIDSLSDDGYEAVMTVASNMSEGFDAKSVGGKLRRVGRMANNFDRFDPNAIDADGDSQVQEGTRFQRPAAPRNMPKVKPIQVPRREDVPLKPSVPSTPTPAPTRVPEKPRVPQRARVSGAMGRNRTPSRENMFEDFFPAETGRLAPLDGNLGGPRPGQSPTGFGSLRDMIRDDEERLNKKPSSSRSRISGSMGAKKKKAPNMLSPDIVDDIFDMEPDDAWSLDFPDDMFDELNISEAESLLYDMRERWKQFAIGIDGNWNNELADRLTYEDEDGIIKHLMRWQDMSKAQAKREAQKLQDMWDRAGAVENVVGSLQRGLKNYIAELEKDED
jgi:hypothetical protein